MICPIARKKLLTIFVRALKRTTRLTQEHEPILVAVLRLVLVAVGADHDAATLIVPTRLVSMSRRYLFLSLDLIFLVLGVLTAFYPRPQHPGYCRGSGV
jgi:hypothetical protein